nr:MAG TPA: attachment protein [Inoviridae sp.]
MIANKKEKAAINNGIGWREPPIPLFMAAFRRKRKFTFALFIKLLFLLLFFVLAKASYAEDVIMNKTKKCGAFFCEVEKPKDGKYKDPVSVDDTYCLGSYCFVWSKADGSSSSSSSSGSSGSSGNGSGGKPSGGSSSDGTMEMVDIDKSVWDEMRKHREERERKNGGSSSGGGGSSGQNGGGKNDGGKNGKNDGGKNGQKQEGEIGPVGGWLKEPEHKAPKGKIYRVAVGCHMDKDCAYEEFSYDLNVSCSGSVSSGKYIPSGHTYSLHVRNGVCYYDVYSKGKLIEERIAKYDSISVNDVPEGKKPKDEKKKDEKPKDDKAKECLDNNPHICKGKDGKWKDTREDGKPKDQQKPEDKGVFKDKDGVYRSEDDGGEVHKDKDGKDGNDGQNGRDGRNAEGKDYGGILSDIKKSIDNVNKSIVDGFNSMKEGRGKGYGSSSGDKKGDGKEGKGKGDGSSSGDKKGDGKEGRGKGDGSSSGDKKGDGKAEEGYQGNPEWDKLNGMGDAEFTKGKKFGEAGYCPAPVRFNISIMGKSMNLSFSYEWICDVARKLRPVVVAFAYCIASAVCLRGLSSS